MASLFIKGTALVTRESYVDDPKYLGSYLLCAMESWVIHNFTNTGEFSRDCPNEVKRKYGEVRSAYEAFQNDIHNLTIGYHQMKGIMENKELESGLKGLYLGNLVEHYITNIRCIYDQMAIFSRIIVDHEHLSSRNVSTESLNSLLAYIRKNPVKAETAFSETLVRELQTLAPSLQIIKTIRDAIIHDGKEPMITFLSGSPQIRISRSGYKRDESLLPDLLGLGSLDYPMFGYLQYITRTLFLDMDRMGEVIISFLVARDETIQLELVALIGICIEDFMTFLHQDLQDIA